jgi:hypothetical protein
MRKANRGWKTPPLLILEKILGRFAFSQLRERSKQDFFAGYLPHPEALVVNISLLTLVFREIAPSFSQI